MTTPDEPTGGINISWDDLSAPDVTQRVSDMQQAQAIPLTRSVGLPPPAQPAGALGWLRGSAGALALAGLVGALVTWGLVELVLQPDSEDPWYGDSGTTGNVLLAVTFAIGLGLTITAWEGVEARSWVKARNAMLRALPYLVGGGAVGGFLTSKVYESMAEDVAEEAMERAIARAGSEEEALDIYIGYVQDHLHLPRGLAIGMVGLTVGVALGAVSRSSKRAVNGAVGGFVGGFLGGFVFDYIEVGDGTVSRLVATVLTGVVVGMAMGLIETARREHWLEIVSGGMAGKQFILYGASTSLGSSPTCDVTLIKDPHVAPHQGQLVLQGDVLTARSTDPGFPLSINGRPVGQQALGDNDLIQLGSTVLRYRARAAAVPAAGPIHG